MLKISIHSAAGELLSESAGQDFINLVYRAQYAEGDTITVSADNAPCFLQIQLDDVMNPSFVYLKDPSYTLIIPFNEKRVSYNPKTFTGDMHLLRARYATPTEIGSYKNLCENEYDAHENTGCFPHAYANVETRGESVFAARNAINGNTENHSHGIWPYESWGINRNPDAEIVVDFGREVLIDKLVLYTRADFPHDNWWKEATFDFSDGTSLTVTMEKSDLPHSFSIAPKKVTWIKLYKLIKDETDPSPFPALSQIEAYGTEA